MEAVRDELVLRLGSLDGVESLKALFLQLFDFRAVLEELSSPTLPTDAAVSLAEPPLLLATKNSISVIFLQFISSEIEKELEREILKCLSHRFTSTLFVISDVNTFWSFVTTQDQTALKGRSVLNRAVFHPGSPDLPQIKVASDFLLACISTEAATREATSISSRHQETFDYGRFRETFLEGAVKCFSRCSDTLSTYYKDEHNGREQSFRGILISLYLHFTRNLTRTPDLNRCIFCPFPGMAEKDEQALFCSICRTMENRDDSSPVLARFPEEVFGEIHHFFEDFPFSILENSPWDRSAAVELSLLASVCERLTREGSASDRGGIVYTPCTEIDLMCRLALAENLTIALGDTYRELIHCLIFAYERHEKKEIDCTVTGLGLWKPLLQKLIPLSICDPSCGGASFLAAMLSLKADLCKRGRAQCGEKHDPFTIRRHIVEHSLYGVDISRWACHFAKLRLWLSLFEEGYCQNEALSLIKRENAFPFSTHLRCFDSLTLPFQSRRKLRKKDGEKKLPRKGEVSWSTHFPEIFAREEPGFDIVIGNPPYVRQEMLVSHSREAFLKEDYKQQAAGHIYQRFPDFFGGAGEVRSIDRRSDLYIYFFFLGFSLLKQEGGTLLFLSSRAWLEVSYGITLREYLFRHSNLRMIIENEMHRSFRSAFINTAIVVASTSRKIAREQKSHFILLKMPFLDAVSSSLFKNSTIDKKETAQYQLTSVAQSELCRTVTFISDQSRRNNDHHSGQSKGNNATVGLRSGKSLILKSGESCQNGFLPRAPEIYRTVLKKGRDILIPLGSFTSLKRGVTTGANEFFYLDSSALLQWEIEEDYLKPLIKSPRGCRRMLIDPEKHNQRVFICRKDREELRGTKALDYILQGEEHLFHMRPSLRGKSRWWELKGIEGVTHLWQKSVDRRHLQCQLIGDAIIDQRLYQLYYPAAPFALTAVLNSAITILFREVTGRVSLGEGALDCAVYEALSMPVVDPLRLDEMASKDLILALSARDIKAVDEELAMSDRSGVDHPIFDLLSLTAGEREAVYEAVLSLVESRITRAKCFRKPH